MSNERYSGAFGRYCGAGTRERPYDETLSA